MAEFGSCHRNEPSGALHGLMRVRGFTQDDAHIFCTEEQILSEVNNCIKLIYDVYSTFGFEKSLLSCLLVQKNASVKMLLWDIAETDLAKALTDNNIEFEYQPGEGAFLWP